MAIDTFDPADLDDLRVAKTLLENPGLAARLTALLGTPVEKGFEYLPENWNQKIGELTRDALTRAADAAVFTMKNLPGKKAKRRLHKLAAAATGGIGGFFGLPALAVELPISTTIMLRSIADIARSEGENIHAADSKIACIEVFGLGGAGRSDNASESGYFVVRASLAGYVADSLRFLANRGLTEESAPALVRLIVRIAERFSLQVSQKAAAQAVPAIGAAGGALINSLFMGHFQDMARGHFTVRRLERKYGTEPVQEIYRSLSEAR